MIRIQIEAQGKKMRDGLYKENTTQGEVAMAIFQLEKVKKDLLELQFDDLTFELEKGDDGL